MSMSYTCGFSKEDEKRELDGLTQIEKQKILDDKYGKQSAASTSSGNLSSNNNGDEADDDEVDDEVDDEEDECIDEFYRAMSELPPDQSGNFYQAHIYADEEIELECNPMNFIRHANYDMNKAVLLMCEYWNTRVEIFGDDDAFLPLTPRKGGAMEDVAPYLVEMKDFFRILPEDDHGRTVLCIYKQGLKYPYKHYDYRILVSDCLFLILFACLNILTKFNLLRHHNRERLYGILLTRK